MNSSNKLPPKSVDESLLLEKIQQKEEELQMHGAEIDSLITRLNKATSELRICEFENMKMILSTERLQDELKKSNNELSYMRDRHKEMVVRWWNSKNELVKTKEELNEKKKELEEANERAEFEMMRVEEQWRKELSYMRYNDEQMRMEWWNLNNKFVVTKDRLNKKIKELTEANESADFKMMKMKLEVEQWRKAAKAIASVLVEGTDICSKTPKLESLVLYYTNRAAKRISLGKIRKALDDCKKATLLNPGFLKACLIAGRLKSDLYNHLVLGDIDNASYNYKKCLDSGIVCFDRRLTIDAHDGLQNAEKVVSCINKLAELMQHRTLESATTALEVIKEALSISPYSEKVLEMKGEALFMLHKYEEVIQMCEETLTSAEKYHVTIDDNNNMSYEDQVRPLKIWRWNLMSRSYFHMAKFDLSLAALENYEQLAPPETKTHRPSSLSSANIGELLRCKNAGNEAFKSGKYREAVDHYSTAIMQSIESQSFTAICLCNRAAALQALGKVTDAIADCNLAIALDGDYMKAFSRRAKLHEKIRDYEHAAHYFQRLISLLEKKSETKYEDELALARRHLSSMNKNMKKGFTMDLYLILGLKGSESGSEIKKAYHKAALIHHPDKAGKFLLRSKSGLDGHVWKEIYTAIHKDADKLFKIIGEAYAVLSDANKRFNYNLKEDDFGWNFNE